MNLERTGHVFVIRATSGGACSFGSMEDEPYTRKLPNIPVALQARAGPESTHHRRLSDSETSGWTGHCSESARDRSLHWR